MKSDIVTTLTTILSQYRSLSKHQVIYSVSQYIAVLFKGPKMDLEWKQILYITLENNYW